jgi:transcriptional repressor NrdR
MASRLWRVDCPLCEAASRVLESRSSEAGAAIRRRRECSQCGHRFTTYERYEQSLFVRKRNGRRQPFDPAKLRDGLARAAHKRPVSDSEIDTITEAIQSALAEAGGELPSAAIGELCLRGLGRVDRGAFLQFAGTLPPEDVQMLAADSEFAGSLRSGSVRSESDSPQSTPITG